MPTVWRVENDRYEGPYGSVGDDGPDLSHHDTSRDHPNPFLEGEPFAILTDDPEEARSKYLFVFGFSSEEQLSNWFCAEDLGMLNGHGYHVRAYEVSEEDIIRGNKQCIFIHPLGKWR